jgi:hypothetical protein
LARKSTKRPELEPAQRDLAKMIDSELNRGQRGDRKSSEKYWTRWRVAEFAKAAKISESSVQNYRDSEKLNPPDNIIPLLNAFYGDIEKYQPARDKMHSAWQLAKGYITDGPLAPPLWDIDNPKAFTEPVELVQLGLHQPVPGNEGTMRVTGTLRLHPDMDCEYEGRAVSIGLTEALVAICLAAGGGFCFSGPRTSQLQTGKGAQCNMGSAACG